MGRFYRPSGKISGWYFLYMMICIVGIVPLFASEYTFLASLMGWGKIKAVLFLVNVVLMEYCCQDVAMRRGKVRSGKAAILSALLLSIVFMAVSCAVERQMGGNREGIGIRAAQFLAVLLVYSAGFLSVISGPFCEDSGKWAKRVSILFQMPEDTDSLLRKLLTDHRLQSQLLLNELQAIPLTYEQQSGTWLQVVTGSHLLLELWVTEGASDFYLTVVKKSAKQGRGGQLRWSEKELVRCLAISRDFGAALLTLKGAAGDRSATACMEGARGFSWIRILAGLRGAGSLALLVVMFTQLEGRFGGRLPVAAFLFYGAFVFLISLLSLIGSFLKDVVMVSDRINPEELSAGKRQNVKLADSGLLAKLYFAVLLAGSAGLFAAALYIYG